jgi:competence protein ComEA
MATKGERRALLFLAVVALLGAGTRAYRARRDAVPTGDLDRQIGAVETSATRGRKGGRGSSLRKRGRPSKPDRRSGSGEFAPAARLAEPYPARSTSRIDLDAATPTDIERLPGVGPAIAKRIVADREAKGTFGCLAALDAVRGIGRAMLTRLDSLVTFSGAPRAACGQR